MMETPIQHIVAEEKTKANFEPLALHTPALVEESLDMVWPRVKNLKEEKIAELLLADGLSGNQSDEDRRAWLTLLGLSCEGYARGRVLLREKNSKIIQDIQNQMSGGGFKDWMSAWNTIRWIPGQSERMRLELAEYEQEYRRTGQFPWMPAMIGLIIMLVRIDHPEYQIKYGQTG